MDIVNQHIDELKSLCEKHYVSELYVFGSVAKKIAKVTSDIDFLVGFKAMDPLEYFDNYMDFKDALSKLFSRKVDLVEIQTVKNPVLKKSIERDKTMLYG